jgi:hypothetical protein
MLSKAFKISFCAISAAISTDYLIENHFVREANAIGAIRFGRAALVVNIFI